ncbi:hypothetical protein CAEBREN_15324 [Caenorhabditis brenneri]|uniref:Uncharacterized protein n=1 Tax=Caenorhabditis brenneri TaxID=135651 RepID=G0P1G9_CAEBE|nr:hypothetical protein CAEBREN_15324 [Caenorhabditis brenneri]
MTGTQDVEIVDQQTTPKTSKKSADKAPKRASAKTSNNKPESTAPPTKKRGSKLVIRDDETGPLIPAGFESDQDDGNVSDTASHRSPSPASSVRCPDMACLREDIAGITTAVEQVATHLGNYATGVNNILQPVQENLKTLNNGICYRNSSEQDLLNGFVKEAKQLVRDLKDQKDKPASIRYTEQIGKMEQNISGIATAVTGIATAVSNNATLLGNINAFLAGFSTGPRFSLQPQMGVYSAQGPPNPLNHPSEGNLDIEQRHDKHCFTPTLPTPAVYDTPGARYGPELFPPEVLPNICEYSEDYPTVPPLDYETFENNITNHPTIGELDPTDPLEDQADSDLFESMEDQGDSPLPKPMGHQGDSAARLENTDYVDPNIVTPVYIPDYAESRLPTGRSRPFLPRKAKATEAQYIFAAQISYLSLPSPPECRQSSAYSTNPADWLVL